MSVLRSLLFAPGNHFRKVEKALTLDADAVILDLEDAVAVAEKVPTRETVAKALSADRRSKGYVRVNAYDTPYCFGDIQAVVGHGLDGIVLPKVETPDQLLTIDWVITQLERDRGLDVGMIDLIPIIETGKGLAVVEEIAHSPKRVRRLSFGAGDFSLDMNIRWTMEEHELDYARAKIATASRAARLESPLDTVFIHLGALDSLRSSSERARNFGFQGKLCIHPEQIEPVNQVFSPSSEEIQQAERVAPNGSRAYFRGICLKKFPKHIYGMSWTSVLFDVGDTTIKRVPLMDLSLIHI